VAKLAILISTFLSLVANWNVGVAMYPNWSSNVPSYEAKLISFVIMRYSQWDASF
jgi:hypothetical protein